MWKIRPYTADDYVDIATIASAAFPEDPTSPRELAYFDKIRPAYIHFGRWVLTGPDAVVQGYAHYTQYADMYDPQRLWITVVVNPAYRRQGAGTALYTHLMHEIKRLDGIEAVKVIVRENQPGGLAFAEQHGFKEVGRRWPSRLDITTADLAPFGAAIDKVTAQEIRIVPLADLLDDPECARKFYQLYSVVDSDVPIDEPLTKLSFEQFRTEVFNNPFLVKEGTFIALDGAEYVGMSSLSEDNGLLFIDLTGILASYRRRGIALALKVRGMQFAQGKGYPAILTVNDPVNVGMLAINDWLGFARMSAMIKYFKAL